MSLGGVIFLIFPLTCTHVHAGPQEMYKSILNSVWGLVFIYLTLILLTWRIWWAPNNASRWQIGFNWAFKGLINSSLTYSLDMNVTIKWDTRPWGVRALRVGTAHIRHPTSYHVTTMSPVHTEQSAKVSVLLVLFITVTLN